jgi:ParB-like chromosome segregation protein Spo0J
MTDQELKDLVASFAIDRKETAQQMRETDKKIAKMSKRVDSVTEQMGGINSNIGYHAEQF